MPDLRTLRHRRGLTIFEVAQRSGLTARAIAELEFGMCPFDSTERLALAHVYDVAPEDLKAPQTVLASRSWQNLANILSRQLILAGLVSTLMVMMLFGEAVYGAESHTPVPSASPAALGANLGVRLSRPYLSAPTTNSRRRPDTTLQHDVLEGVSAVVVLTVTPTATPQPAPTEVSNPIPTDAPSPMPAATLQPVSPETPNPLPTETLSLLPTEAPNPVPTDALNPAPTDALGSVPAQAPGPMPPEAPGPTPPEAPSPTPPEAPSASSAAVYQENTVFMSLGGDGSFRQNVVAALEANNGVLQHVVIPPDGIWSFNRSVGDPDLLQLDSVYGVYGGGWCDLASRYTMVLRPFLPPESFAFIRHIDSTGYGLEGVSDDDAVVIWNSNGGDGEQDLRIHNTSGRTISIRATLTADGVQLQATLE
jgi:transcriptional regulator with XRE-family HTH domain